LIFRSFRRDEQIKNPVGRYPPGQRFLFDSFDQKDVGGAAWIYAESAIAPEILAKTLRLAVVNRMDPLFCTRIGRSPFSI
jgi:hypothetical protein